MSGSAHKLSTSALAKALDLPLNQLFATLKDYGWIRKLDDGWALTGKGEFEGGEYVHSKRFGRYIVWPESLLEHRLLTGLEANRRLGAVQLGRRFGITPREFNRVLAERGLLEPGTLGWRLSARGERMGGVECDSDHSGLPYTLWPETLLDESDVAAALAFAQSLKAAAEGGAERDLFGHESRFESLDGHCLQSLGELMICHWLYLAGLPHACGRSLPGGGELRADFYLPQQQLYIEYLGDERAAATLSATLARLEWYRQQQWPVIEVRPEHLPQLDDYLTRALRRHGVDLL